MNAKKNAPRCGALKQVIGGSHRESRGSWIPKKPITRGFCLSACLVLGAVSVAALVMARRPVVAPHCLQRVEFLELLG